eukprot:5047339-Pleurochrysis_carterae.AAC.2
MRHKHTRSILREAVFQPIEIQYVGQQGNLISIIPPESAMVDGERCERTPFWLAQIEMDEESVTDKFGRRRDPIDPHDEFMVS